MAETTKLRLKGIIVGDSDVGKAQLLRYYIAGKVPELDTPVIIGTDFVTYELNIDGRSVILEIWDTAGQERFRSIGAAFYRAADFCLLVYDVTSADSFKSLDRWRDEVFIQADPWEPEKFPFVVIGNKIELDGRVITRETAENWCQGKDDIPYFETPSQGDSNVEKAFETAARNAIAREIYNAITTNFLQSYRLTDKNKSNSSKKCSC